MQYKPKSVAALQVALGGLPGKMPVSETATLECLQRPSANFGRWPRGREFGDNNPAGTSPRKCCKDQQGERSYSHVAQAVSKCQTSQYQGFPKSCGLWGRSMFGRCSTMNLPSHASGLREGLKPETMPASGLGFLADGKRNAGAN